MNSLIYAGKATYQLASQPAQSQHCYFCLCNVRSISLFLCCFSKDHYTRKLLRGWNDRVPSIFAKFDEIITNNSIGVILTCL